MKLDEALKITRSGITINVGTAVLTATNIPVNEAGESPRAVRLLVDTGVAYVKVAAGNLTGGNPCVPTLNDIMVTPNSPMVLNTRGQGLINAITRLSTCNLNVVPIEV